MIFIDALRHARRTGEDTRTMSAVENMASRYETTTTFSHGIGEDFHPMDTATRQGEGAALPCLRAWVRSAILA